MTDRIRLDRSAPDDFPGYRLRKKTCNAPQKIREIVIVPFGDTAVALAIIVAQQRQGIRLLLRFNVCDHFGCSGKRLKISIRVPNRLSDRRQIERELFPFKVPLERLSSE